MLRRNSASSKFTNNQHTSAIHRRIKRENKKLLTSIFGKRKEEEVKIKLSLGPSGENVWTIGE